MATPFPGNEGIVMHMSYLDILYEFQSCYQMPVSYFVRTSTRRIEDLQCTQKQLGKKMHRKYPCMLTKYEKQ